MNLTESRDYPEKRWRISPRDLIQIELVWLLLAGVIGWLLGDLPGDQGLAIAYRKLAGGNVLGLFVLGNALGYLLHEEVNMVLARMHNDEVIAKAVAKAVAAAKAEAAAAVRAEEVPQAVAAAKAEAVAAQAEAVAAALAEAVAAAKAEAVAAAKAEMAAQVEALETDKAELAAQLAAAAAAKAEPAAQTETAAPAPSDAVAQAMAAELPKVVAETLAQERRAVAVWYARLQQAQREGLPFDEPPPGYANGAAGAASAPG